MDFLTQLKAFTQDAVKDLALPVRRQEEDREDPAPRPAEVHLMRLPDSRAARKKAPYIIHQFLTGDDSQTPGSRAVSSAQVRSIFCVYHDDEELGGLALLGLMERFRIELLKKAVIANRYELDLEAKLERLVYPDDTAPYFGGEMVTVWKLPAVKREVIYYAQSEIPGGIRRP